jgi:hypothetical protein
LPLLFILEQSVSIIIEAWSCLSQFVVCKQCLLTLSPFTVNHPWDLQFHILQSPFASHVPKSFTFPFHQNNSILTLLNNPHFSSPTIRWFRCAKRLLMNENFVWLDSRREFKFVTFDLQCLTGNVKRVRLSPRIDAFQISLISHHHFDRGLMKRLSREIVSPTRWN